MEQIINMIASWKISIGEGDSITLDSWEMTTLQLWLLMAINTETPRPLWLKGKNFVSCKDGNICFEDVYSTLNRGQAIELINAIYNLTYDENTGIHLLGLNYPASNSWHSKFDNVDVKEEASGSYIGYWVNNTDRSNLPVKLRWSEDLGVWYGVKSDTRYGLVSGFKNLSIGQI